MKITLALLNGRIYTMRGTVAEAVAVSDDKIVRIGTTGYIKSMCDNSTNIIDLKGKTVLPGFNDSHMHLVSRGLVMDSVDLFEASSINEIISRGKAFIKDKNKKAGEWIRGWGWNQNLFEDKRFPSRHDLDLISTEHPILFTRACGHVAVSNTCALKLIGVNPDTYVQGGSFEHDEKGNPTGLMKENAVGWFMERLPKADIETLKKAASNAVQEALSFGLTSVQSSDLDYCGGFDNLNKVFNSLKEEGKLQIRINEQLVLTDKEMLFEAINRGLITGKGDDFYRIGPVKLFTDGSLGARTAALREEYSDDIGNGGMLIYSQDELDELVETAHKNRMQVFIHAIGDAAIEQSINAIERASSKNAFKMRHRLNHVQIGALDLFERMAASGIIADIQPVFVSSDYRMVKSRVGIEREKTSYAWKTMMDMGIKLAGGSDCPIESCNPIFGIYAAVTRNDIKGEPIGGWMPKEQLSVYDAVKLFTLGSAYASFDEHKKGAIARGMLADMVVLSEDIFKVNPDNIKDIKVETTIVGGQIRYVRK